MCSRKPSITSPVNDTDTSHADSATTESVIGGSWVRKARFLISPPHNILDHFRTLVEDVADGSQEIDHAKEHKRSSTS